MEGKLAEAPLSSSDLSVEFMGGGRILFVQGSRKISAFCSHSPWKLVLSFFLPLFHHIGLRRLLQVALVR
jgi:hypothetical protein